ncbi:MAG: terminase small subunit [Oscillospiraceae bacterium]|nr:terminase small subunit [Oscillospiraceae bacterium]
MAEEKELTAKEERFCLEYIIDYHGTKAAIRAGYSEKSAAVTASKLLKKANIAARVRENQRIYNETRCFDEKDRVLAEAWNIYDIATAAKPVMEWDYSERKYVETGEYQIDGRTAAKALEIVMKLGGMGNETLNHKFGDGGIEINVNVAGDEE